MACSIGPALQWRALGEFGAVSVVSGHIRARPNHAVHVSCSTTITIMSRLRIAALWRSWRCSPGPQTLLECATPMSWPQAIVTKILMSLIIDSVTNVLTVFPP